MFVGMRDIVLGLGLATERQNAGSPSTACPINPNQGHHGLYTDLIPVRLCQRCFLVLLELRDLISGVHISVQLSDGWSVLSVAWVTSAGFNEKYPHLVCRQS
jgi:hypothetical protein